MRVLNLVTNERARFFQQQVSALESRGVTFTTIPVPDDHSPGEPRSVLDYLRIVPGTVGRSFGDYDLVHANNGLTAPAALAQPNLPVLVTLWGSDLLGQYGAITRRCARRCEGVVVMSEEMAAHLECESTVIPHGVDLERFAPKPRASARERLDWPTDRHVVLFPYSPDREIKDYPRAERVVEAARERLDGPIELRTVTGVPHAEMPTYYNAADLLLLPSEREGSPNAVKEAMACNVPVVATPVGDVPERLDGIDPSAVGDTDEALVEGVVTVLRDDRRRSDGRERIQVEVSVAATSARLHEVYRDVAGSA